MLQQKSVFAEITRYIRLADRNKGVQGHANYGWCSSAAYNHYISSADALLRLMEKEITGKTRGARGLKGLTKRLASLEG